jgi:hypothetical protein
MEAPAAAPAAPAKKRRGRRTAAELAAAKASNAPELISFTVNGIAISAAPEAAAQLLKHLAA